MWATHLLTLPLKIHAPFIYVITERFQVYILMGLPEALTHLSHTPSRYRTMPSREEVPRAHPQTSGLWAQPPSGFSTLCRRRSAHKQVTDGVFCVWLLLADFPFLWGGPGSCHAGVAHSFFYYIPACEHRQGTDPLGSWRTFWMLPACGGSV